MPLHTIKDNDIAMILTTGKLVYGIKRLPWYFNKCFTFDNLTKSMRYVEVSFNK